VKPRRSHQPDSDADVAVLLAGPPGKVVQTTLALDDRACKILLETGVRIQPLPVWQSEWEHPENYLPPSSPQNCSRGGPSLNADTLLDKANTALSSAKYLLQYRRKIAAQRRKRYSKDANSYIF
jgi:hypothetical protein